VFVRNTLSHINTRKDFLTKLFCLPIFSMNVFHSFSLALSRVIFLFGDPQSKPYVAYRFLLLKKCQPERIPLLFLLLFLSFGAAKLHILFSPTKYFFIVIKKIFLSSLSLHLPLHNLLKKREGKDTESFLICKMFGVKNSVFMKFCI
jgi:hypothetical protein